MSVKISTPLPPWKLFIQLIGKPEFANVLTADDKIILKDLPLSLAKAIVVVANRLADGGLTCPKCLRANAHRRTGPHFENELRCPNCSHRWES